MPLIFDAAKIALEEAPSVLARVAQLPLIRSSKWAEFVADLPKMSEEELGLRARRDNERKGLECLLSQGTFRPSFGARDFEVHNVSPGVCSAEYAIKEGRKQIKSGYFEAEPDASIKFALLRSANDSIPERFRNEVGAYNLHYASAFTNDFPVTLLRPDPASGVGQSLVQERFGRSLSAQLRVRDWRTYGQSEADTGYGDLFQSHTFKNTFGYQDHIKDLLEQSVAERISVFGDNDGFPRNFAVRARPNELRIANIDLDHRAFRNDYPSTPAIEQFSGEPISSPTLSKLDHFLTKFSSKPGKKFMQELQFTKREIDHVYSRTKSLLDSERFPGASKNELVD
jgi:hypothetical protein